MHAVRLPAPRTRCWSGARAALAWRLALATWLMALATWLLAGPAAAQDLQAIPALTARVMDQASVLQPAQRAALEAKLAAFEAQAGPQIVVLTVASTGIEDIADYAQRAGDAWKIGRKDVGDGLLLVVARDDRKLRIQVAKALEGAVPDLAARQILANSIAPAFKRGDYAAGLDAGVDALIARLRGENLPAPAAQGGRGAPASGFDWEELAVFFFIAVPVLGGVLTSVLGRKLGSVVTAGGAGTLAWWLSASLLVGGLAGVVALVLVGVMGVGAARGIGRGRGGPPIIWGGGGGGGGFGGGGGGGFGSGGGGDFGGGGASGGW